MKSNALNRFPPLKIMLISSIIVLTCFCQTGFAQEKLKVATCQFPVTGNLKSNADYIKKLIKEAAQKEN